MKSIHFQLKLSLFKQSRGLISKVTSSILQKNKNTPRIAIDKRQPYSFIGLIVSLCCLFSISIAGQTDYPDLDDDGLWHEFGYTETAQVFQIPENMNGNTINFLIKGGDGGKAEVGVGGICIAQGGRGAEVSGRLIVGDGPGQIPVGAYILFVPGDVGKSKITDGLAGAGGGGAATGLLAYWNGKWRVLAVAGGGGGAYQGLALLVCVDHQAGEGGRVSEDGGNGGGSTGSVGFTRGDGGQDGAGGGCGNCDADGSGGGAGLYGDGENTDGNNIPAGGLAPDIENDDFYGEGGYAGQYGGNGATGFIGGGGGLNGGGGGGGYSGGGGGAKFENGGGGGSYFDAQYVYGGKKQGGQTTLDPKVGTASYRVEDQCLAVVHGFDFINPICAENDLGRIQLDYTQYGGSVCNGSLDFSLDPVNGWSHLGNGEIRSVRVGDYTVQVKNTELDLIVNTKSISVEVADEEPVARCKTTTVNLVNGSYSNNNFADLIDNGSSGICDPVISASQTSFDCSDIGLSLVTLTITGSHGVSNSCAAAVTVQEDPSDPVTALCQPAKTIELQGGNSVSLSTSDIDNGSYTGFCSNSIYITPTSFGCDDIGEQTVTLTVGSGNNMASCTTTITIQDSQEGPTAVCLEETIFRSLDESGNASINAAEVDFGSSSNNCTDLTYSLDQTAFNCDDIGENTVTLTVTDGNGKTNSCTSTVHIQDNSAPVPSCEDITIGLDENGTYTLNPSELDNGSSDNCGIESLTASRTDFDCNDLGTTTAVTLYVRDNTGLETNCTANVTVTDNIAPEAYCTNLNFNMTGNAIGIGIYKTIFLSPSFDNCDIVSSNFSKSTFNCSNIGENEVIFQVKDAAGNTDECTFTVTLTETGTPNIVCQDISVNLDETGSATITPGMIDNGTTDACSPFSLALDVMTFDCDDIGEQIVTLTATDSYGNQSSCEAKVNVEDVTAPTAVCQGALTLDQTQLQIGLQNQQASHLGQSFMAGLTGSLSKVRVYLYGFASSGETVAPTIEILEGETVTGTPISSVESIPMATSEPTPNQWFEIIFSTPAQVTAGNQYTIVIRANRSSTDETTAVGTLRALNPYPDGSLVFHFGVSPEVDMPFETFITGSDIIVVLDKNTETASISPTEVDGGSSDECGIAWYLIDKTNFTTADIGENTVNLTVIDNSDNTSTCSTKVIVQDYINEAPTAICKDITVSVDENCETSITADQINGGSSDANGDPISLSLNNSGPFGFGEHSVTLSVSDGELSSSCIASVTVEDQMAPIARCIPNNSFTLEIGEPGFGNISALDIDNGSSDACSSVSLEVLGGTFDCTDIAQDQTVTLVVTDAYDNQSSCETTIRVTTEGPIVSCQDLEKTLELDAVVEINPQWVAKTVTVPCPAVEVGLSLDQTSFSCENAGSNTVTLTATDAFGKSSSCQAVIRIIPDLIAKCQDITVGLDQNGETSITPDQIDNGSLAACGEVNLALDINSFDCDDLGINTATLTVSSEDGREQTCIANVEVVDEIAPTAVCQDITVQLGNNRVALVPPTILDNGSSDNCNLASIDIIEGSIGYDCDDVGGTFEMTLQATDVAGLSSTCIAMVTVEDQNNECNQAPTAICQDITVNVSDDCETTISPEQVDAGSSDPDGDQLSFSLDNTGPFGISEYTVTLTVSDGALSSTCTAAVSVVDETDPSLTCPGDQIVNTDPGECGAYVTLPKAAPADNCGIKNLKSRYRALDEAGSPTGSWSSWESDHSGFFELGAYQVQWRAKDESNNKGFCSFTLNVIDEEAPTVVCQDISINFNGEATIAIDPTAIFDEAASFDACGAVSFVSQSISEVSCPDIGQNLVAEVVAADSSGNTSTCSAQISVTGLPCGFQASDIDCSAGAVATYDPQEESFTLTADDCSGYPDGEWSLVTTELCGDGEIVANIASLSSNARVGVTMMEDNVPGARFVSKIKDLTPRTRTEYRSSTGGSISFKSKNRSNVKWVRIVRDGSKFKTYTSTNGSYWRLSHSITFPSFDDCIYAGLVLYSKDANAPATAVIKQVKVMGDAHNSLTASPGAAPAAIESPLKTELEEGLQADLQLSVAPNPFAEQTQIEFTLPKVSDVTLEIYNLHGQRVRNLESAQLDAGTHLYQWDGTNSKGTSLPTSIYMLRLRVDKKWVTSKVSLIKR